MCGNIVHESGFTGVCYLSKQSYQLALAFRCAVRIRVWRYTSVSWALSIDVLPSLANAGKDLGVWNASTTLPTLVAPLLGSVIINIAAGAGQTALGYRMVLGQQHFSFFSLQQGCCL